MYWRVFFYIPGHQYILIKRLIVLSFPKCLAVGLSWFSRSTFSRKAFRTYTISLNRINPFDSLVLLLSSNLVALSSHGVFCISVIVGFSAVTRLVACIVIFSSRRLLVKSLLRKVASSLSYSPIRSDCLLRAFVITLFFSLQCLILKLYWYNFLYYLA
jgi:hypothetical protein